MSRSSIDIIEDPRSMTFVRCDGEKIEEIQIHEDRIVIRELSILDAFRRARQYMDAALQIANKPTG